MFIPVGIDRRVSGGLLTTGGLRIIGNPDGLLSLGVSSNSKDLVTDSVPGTGVIRAFSTFVFPDLFLLAIPCEFAFVHWGAHIAS